MLKIYFPLPNGKSFAFVARCGSTSLATACLKQFFPELYDKWISIQDREHGGYAHRMLPHRVTNDLPSGCVVVIRNPVERFMSLCARTGTDPALALLRVRALFGSVAPERREQLETATWDWMNHFRPVSTIAQTDSRLVRFEHVSEAFELLGCSNFTHINAIDHDSAEEDFHAAVLAAYAEDQRLWSELP